MAILKLWFFHFQSLWWIYSLTSWWWIQYISTSVDLFIYLRIYVYLFSPTRFLEWFILNFAMYCLLQAEEWLSDISNPSLLFCLFTLILHSNGANFYLLSLYKVQSTFIRRYLVLFCTRMKYLCLYICIYTHLSKHMYINYVAHGET